VETTILYNIYLYIRISWYKL